MAICGKERKKEVVLGCGVWCCRSAFVFVYFFYHILRIEIEIKIEAADFGFEYKTRTIFVLKVLQATMQIKTR